MPQGYWCRASARGPGRSRRASPVSTTGREALGRSRRLGAWPFPPTGASGSTSAGAGCSSRARSSSPATPTRISRWPRSREAGISKALLYHYFPSKQAFFVATLEQQAAELAARLEVDPWLPPAVQLATALDAFLGWVDEHAEGYGKLLVGAATHPEVR